MTTSQPQEGQRTAIDVTVCLLPGGIDHIYTALPLSIALIDATLPNPVARRFQTSGPIPPDRHDVRQALSAGGFVESERTTLVPEAVLASLARCATLLRSIADGGERAFDYADPAAFHAAQLLNDVGRADLLEWWKLEEDEQPDDKEV
jgi:hypothetical protein